MAAGGFVIFGELGRDQLKSVARDGLIVLPTGATEQHGPHLPTGTDSVHTEYVARAAAQIVCARLPIAVAPTLPFGMSHHHLPFGGTISVDARTYLDFLVAVGESLASWGTRRLFILNGHGGNHEMIQSAARELVFRCGMEVGCGSWWNIAYDRLVAIGALEVGKLPGHSGGFETSVMLAIDPQAVASDRPARESWTGSHETRFQDLYRQERPDSWLKIDGYSDSPAGGNAEIGKAFLDAAIDEVARVFLEFSGQT